MQAPGTLLDPSFLTPRLKTAPSKFLYSNIRKFPIFSQEKTVLIFQGMETLPKNCFI